jgi:hypothetical protein
VERWALLEPADLAAALGQYPAHAGGSVCVCVCVCVCLGLCCVQSLRATLYFKVPNSYSLPLPPLNSQLA